MNFKTVQLRLLSIFFIAMPLYAQALDFTYTSNGSEITITGYTGTDTALVIPDEIDNLPVKTIGRSAFKDDTTLTSVVLQNGVKIIESSAFRNCINLTNVVFPDGIEFIDGFYGCSSLTKITIPDGTKELRGATFKLTGLTDIVIPDSVTSVGSYVFSKCSNLTNFTWSSNTTNIPPSSFEDCIGLTSVTIPRTVTQIDSGAFSDCTSLTNVTFHDRLISLGGFYGCTGLTKVVIPDSVSTLGTHAFKYCSNLTNVVLSGSISTLPNYLFQHCTSLKSLYFKGSAPSVSSTDVFEGIPSDAMVYYIPNTTGWGPTWEGFATDLWLPRMEVGDGMNYQCSIVWTKGLDVVVEASESLSDASWKPIQLVTLNNDRTEFTDPELSNYATRFYRISLP